MKKMTVKFLALALVLASLFSLASCSLFAKKPNRDLEDAADILEDAKYDVSYIDDEDDLSIGYVEYLHASKKDDYIRVIVFADAKLANLYYESLKMDKEFERDELKLEIKSLEHMLKKYEDDMDSDEVDNYEDELKEAKKELDELDEVVIGKSGKTVWKGTKKAIEDSKD